MYLSKNFMMQFSVNACAILIGSALHTLMPNDRYAFHNLRHAHRTRDQLLLSDSLHIESSSLKHSSFLSSKSLLYLYTVTEVTCSMQEQRGNNSRNLNCLSVFNVCTCLQKYLFTSENCVPYVPKPLSTGHFVVQDIL